MLQKIIISLNYGINSQNHGGFNVLKRIITLVLMSVLVCVSAFAATPAPDNAAVYIISPANGAVVTSPVTVKFGLKGMGVAPAGVDKKDTGHHHLLIDSELPALNKAIGKDDKHLHFGGGQTETTLLLTPGQHTLQLILGDKAHFPHKPPVVSEKITITVK